MTAETNALTLANKKLEGIEDEMITRVQTRDQLIITERMYKTEAQRELKINIEAAEKATRASVKAMAEVATFEEKVQHYTIILKTK